MDSRQSSQHPYSRNTTSPYSRAPFQSPSQAPFPPPTSQSTQPVYEHQRRPSDPYYPPQRNYGQESGPPAGQTHSRHQSTSSIGHRSMPPPSSPQQHPQQHGYPQPPLSRGPPPSLGPPSNFGTSSRDLPSLSSIVRPGSTGSAMSISSMLGGPPPAATASTPYPPPPISGSSSTYPGSVHASPRATPASGPDYPGRRPQTPEYGRPHDAAAIRDGRANSAGSPPTRGPSYASTPESNRYNSSQYPSRNSQGPPPPHDERRDSLGRGMPPRPPPNAGPPRPNSQPSQYNQPPHRLSDPPRLEPGQLGPRTSGSPHMGDMNGRIPGGSRQSDSPHMAQRMPDRYDRNEPSYARPFTYDNAGHGHDRRQEEEAAIARDRELRERDFREREARERDMREREVRETRERDMRERDLRERELRERELRERDLRDRDRQRGPPLGPEIPPSSVQNGHYGSPMAQHQQPLYNRPPDARDPRDPGPWPRPGYDQPQERPPYDYPGRNSGPYQGGVGYPPNDPRYPPTHAPLGPAQHGPPGDPHAQEQRDRAAAALQGPPQPAGSQQYPPQNQQGPYPPQESPRGRLLEEPIQQSHRGGLLAVHEINQKGRRSPLPQAVQGAQGQLHGPAGEPGIKSEFGRMFAGIGSGVGKEMAAAIPSPGGSQSARREDLEGTPAQEVEGGTRLVRTASGRSVKRRKFKEEEGKPDEDSSNDRGTPSARGSKRPKPHHHHYPPGYHHHHHHHHARPEGGEEVTSPQESSTPGAHHHHLVTRHHHHHHVTPSKGTSAPPQPINTIIPKPKQVVRSAPVLSSVAHLPRKHLGHATYESHVEVNKKLLIGKHGGADRGFSTTPRPLPRFEGKENCTFTIRVPRVHLSAISREELTSNRPVWGTDIYTDDSDIIAACIHSGWIRGEWPEDIDISLLDLVIDASEDVQNGTKENAVKPGIDVTMTEPPPTGPMVPLPNMDLNVTVLLLPALERYSSTIRWGMRSREWSNNHDGISFMIQSIKWVDGEDTWKAVRGEGRRMRMDLALKDEELEEERAWGPLFNNGNEQAYGNAVVKESFVRGEQPHFGDEFKGLGMKSWWVKPAKSQEVVMADKPVEGS